jgi:hypothetical protein
MEHEDRPHGAGPCAYGQSSWTQVQATAKVDCLVVNADGTCDVPGPSPVNT